MGDRLHVLIVLDLETDGGVIRGSLSTVDRDRREFFGWLELAGELEAARTSPPHEPETAPSSPIGCDVVVTLGGRAWCKGVAARLRCNRHQIRGGCRG
jgi:hypothetical protein